MGAPDWQVWRFPNRHSNSPFIDGLLRLPQPEEHTVPIEVIRQ